MLTLSTYIFSCMFTKKGCVLWVDMVKVTLKIPTVVTRSYICHFNFFRQYLDRIFSQIRDEIDCFGKTYQTLQSTCTRTIYLSCSLYMTISSVVAFVLTLLNDNILSNRKDCPPSFSGFLRGKNEHKCTLADFNNITIKAMLYNLF